MAMYSFNQMDIATAREIADTWKYEAPFDFYDATADPDDYQEFVDPNSWPGIFYSVWEQQELRGFFSMSSTEHGTGVGVGMRPNLVGRGAGTEFVRACLGYAKDRCGVSGSITLSVASFNARAIKVYERFGFRATGQYKQPTNGSVFDFVRMELTPGGDNDGITD